MSHSFGDPLAQSLHRKLGLSQSKLAAGILQSPSIITEMAQGKRLSGAQARKRVVAIIGISSKIAMCLAEIALVLRSSGHVAQAVDIARQALAIAREAGEQMMLVLSLNYLGAALIGIEDVVAAH